jgi:vacuolar-type H+-ATPase subunit H
MAKIKVGDFVKKLADKVGNIDQNSQEFIDILSSSVEMDDTIVNHILENTLTMSTASQHPSVRNKIRAEVFNGIDKNIENQLNAWEVGDDAKTQVLSEPDTFKRLKLMEAKIKEHIDGVKGTGKTKSDAEEALKAQVAKLTTDYKSLQDNFTNEKQSLLNQHQEQMINYQLQNMLGIKNYALPKEMAPEMKTSIAMQALQAKMGADGLVIKNEGGKLNLFTKEGTVALDKQNSQILIDKYVDEVLVQNKLVDLSGSGAQNNPAPTAPGTITPPNAPNGSANFQAAMMADIKAQFGN